jgi:hypothetical protein
MVGTVLGNMLIVLEKATFLLVLGMSCIANSRNIQF